MSKSSEGQGHNTACL